MGRGRRRPRRPGRGGVRRQSATRTVARRPGLRGGDPRRARASSRPAATPTCCRSSTCVGVGERTIPADVQAEVVGELRDETRGALRRRARRGAAGGRGARAGARRRGAGGDRRAAVQTSDPVDVEVEVYRSDEDWSKVVLTIAERSSQWTVTSSSVLPGRARPDGRRRRRRRRSARRGRAAPAGRRARRPGHRPVDLARVERPGRQSRRPQAVEAARRSRRPTACRWPGRGRRRRRAR